jgi:hypothetical protein
LPTCANARTARNDADAIAETHFFGRIGGFVDVWEAAARSRHIHRLAQAEAGQDAALDPGIDLPASNGGRVGLGGAHRSRVQGILELLEQFHVPVVVTLGILFEKTVDA